MSCSWRYGQLGYAVITAVHSMSSVPHSHLVSKCRNRRNVMNKTLICYGHWSTQRLWCHQFLSLYCLLLSRRRNSGCCAPGAREGWRHPELDRRGPGTLWWPGGQWRRWWKSSRWRPWWWGWWWSCGWPAMVTVAWADEDWSPHRGDMRRWSEQWWRGWRWYWSVSNGQTPNWAPWSHFWWPATGEKWKH